MVRAAIELEASVSDARFAAFAEVTPVLVAARPEWADHARALGRVADRLVAADGLPRPAQVEQELSLVPLPDPASALPQGRMLRLAVAASTGAALSTRLELYPRGMAPLTALRLSLGALAGPRVLSEAAVRERVGGRFPEEAPLPPRPELDALLDAAGAERVWHDAEDPQDTGYRAHATAGSSAGSTGLVRLDPLGLHRGHA